MGIPTTGMTVDGDQEEVSGWGPPARPGAVPGFPRPASPHRGPELAYVAAAQPAGGLGGGTEAGGGPESLLAAEAGTPAGGCAPAPAPPARAGVVLAMGKWSSGGCTRGNPCDPSRAPAPAPPPSDPVGWGQRALAGRW